MFTHYQDLCQQDRFNIGQLLLYKTSHKWILNFPEKGHFRANVRAEHIADGLKKFVATHSEQGITSASFPALGQEDDNLNWDSDIRPMIQAYLNPLPILVYVHLDEPENPYTNPKRNIRSVRSWLMGQTRHITFDKFWRDIKSIVQTKSNFRTLDSHNLPNELDKHARYIVPLLSQLDYVDAVQLWTVGAERSIGLQYIPPLDRQDNSLVVDLT